MSTISQALIASRALKQYFGPIRPHEDAFVGEPLSHWSAQYSSGNVSMTEDVENWRACLVRDIPSAPALVRLWGQPADTPDMFPLSASSGSPPTGRRGIRLWAPTENADPSRAFLSAIDQLNALLALYTDKPSAPALDVGHLVRSLSSLPVVQAELAEFSEGLVGLCPTPEAVRIASVLSEAAVQHVQHPDITVDSDGELSFDLRLDDGRLVFAELSLDGRLDVGVYGSDGQMLEHDADATCDYFLTVIES